MEHSHEFKPFKETGTIHKEGDKYLTYLIMELCECGAYRVKEYKNEDA